MLTVDKLVNIKEYEKLQPKIKKERLNKTIDIFKDIENKEKWKQKIEEIKQKSEIEMEKREIYLKNKEETKQKKEIEMKNREIYFKNKENKPNISEADDKKKKDIQQKVLEHRQRLQKMYDERMSYHSKN